jgi:flagellar biosynthetic protein FliR
MPPFVDVELLLPAIATVGLIIVRMGFMFMTAPVISSTAVPMKIKAATVVAISVTIYLGMPRVTLMNLDLISFGVACFGEAAVGAAAGVATRLVFGAVETAGQLIGVPMGLGFSSSVDPLTNTESVAPARFFGLIMSMVFLALDLHLLLIKAIIQSFIIMPPGEVVLDGSVGYLLAQKANLVFIAAVSLAAPVLVVLMGVMVSLGILAKVAPKVNLFVLSFAVSTGVGVLALKAAVPNIVAFTRGLGLKIEPLVASVLSGF